MIHLKELDTPDLHTWNGQIASFPEATIFHTREWLEILAEAHKVRPRFMLAVEDDKTVGAFPLLETKKGFLKILASPLAGWATPYLGPLVPEERLQEVLEIFLQMLKAERIDYSELSFTGDIDHSILKRLGFNSERRFTFLLKLENDSELIWERLESSCRRAVRKALKNNLAVFAVSDESFLEQYYQMARDVYRKSGRLPPIFPEFLLSVWRKLYPIGRARILAATYQDKVIAAAFFLVYRGELYYWDGVSYQEYNIYRPNNLIQWEFIKWGSKGGFKRYDMIGANNPSIAKFKETFGPELRSYTYAYKNMNLLALTGRTMFKSIVPLVRRMRLSFSNKTTSS